MNNLIDHEKSMYATELDEVKPTQNCPILMFSSTLQKLHEEVEWVEALLSHILNTYYIKM